MKNRILRSKNKFIVFLLSILGIGGACSFGGCEYGSPYATFVVRGKVMNEDGANISNIKVVMHQNSTLTNPNGQYEVETEEFPTVREFQIRFEDIDGTANNEYQKLDTVVVFVNPEFQGADGSWYHGETSKEFNVKLKEKN